MPRSILIASLMLTPVTIASAQQTPETDDAPKVVHPAITEIAFDDLELEGTRAKPTPS